MEQTFESQHSWPLEEGMQVQSQLSQVQSADAGAKSAESGVVKANRKISIFQNVIFDAKLLLWGRHGVGERSPRGGFICVPV